LNLIEPSPRSTWLLGRSGGARHSLRLLARNRYQLIGACLVAILLPAMMRSGLDIWHWGPGSMENTLLGTFGAMLLGAYLLRRMTVYPGTRMLAHLLPVFGLSYGVAMALFFFARLDYSRFQFAASFILVIAWFGFVALIEPRIRRPNLALLPFGSARKVMRSDRADWRLWHSTDELPITLSGIVVDLRADLGPQWEQFLARAALAGIPIYHWKQIAESLTGTVEVEHLSENTFGALLPSSVYLRFKRVIDCMAAIMLSPIAILIAGAAALAIRFGDDGPVLFKQTRIGLGGRPFTMLKFRTMRCDAKSGPAFTEADDPRITRVGNVLRRYRIDELPQIINILRGEMSWIGPRPEAVELAAWYEDQIPYYSYRHTVRPGITGWAQVNQGNVAEIAAASDKLKFDFYYIKYFSPWLDALIAAKTLHTIVSGHGAR
jgi:lipopolysaccharide/colanic/teichoic acid biosynthesis glycosyltransferase